MTKEGTAVTHVSVGGLVHKSQVDAGTHIMTCAQEVSLQRHTSQIRSRKADLLCILFTSIAIFETPFLYCENANSSWVAS